ncbi:hypothetical protein KBD45_06450 [Candidatus Dojkabacteria bacterium]|nr:hypothetical protein [Candidatus Dojkabacteria bacterium]
MKKIINNSEASTSRDSGVLVLTNIRTFQQNNSKEVRKVRHTKSKILSSPPYFCNKYKSVFLQKDNKGVIYSANSKGIPCNLWKCPRCRIQKAKKLRRILIEIIKLNKLDHLLTLTLDPNLIPKKLINNTGKYITYLFNWYITTLKRKFKKSIKYVWIKEFQKNGNAHLHILLNSFLPINNLRGEWTRIGGGHIMDIQQVKNIEAVAVYVSGYLTKIATATENFLGGERHYSISHSCLKPIKTFVSTKITPHDLLKYLTIDQFYQVYNLFRNSVDNEEIILAPHQEKLNI